MYCKKLYYSAIFAILAILKKGDAEPLSVSRSSKLDQTEISNIFAELLKSLVKVNEERIDVLNKFFKLNDFNTAKNMFRTGSSWGDSPVVALLAVDDEAPAKNVIRQNLVLKSDDSFSSDDDDTTQESNEKNLRIHKKIDKSALDSSHEVFSSENNGPFNKSDSILPPYSSEEKEVKRIKKSKGNLGDMLNCLSCISSCKEAYRNACYYYDRCSRSLYRRLRRECRYSCSSRFYSC